MTNDAMAELARAREELRAALRKGVKGTRAEERIDHLVDEHQAALKTVLAHRLAEQIRGEEYIHNCCDECHAAASACADLIDPEAQR